MEKTIGPSVTLELGTNRLLVTTMDDSGRGCWAKLTWAQVQELKNAIEELELELWPHSATLGEQRRT